MANPAMKGKGDSNERFSLFAPAKVNLGLKILGKRPDGYHELRSLFVPLSIGDRLEFQVGEAGWVGGCDRSDVPTGPGSLVERAFRYTALKLGFDGGLSVRIDKKIPIGGGMGGGSTDAAAVMRAVERISGGLILESDYPEIALKIGADVPFFLKEGAKWVEGIGERVSRLTSIPPLYLILVNPGVSISTKWVYSELKIPPLTSRNAAVSVPPAFGSVEALLPFLTNDLESVVLPGFPVVGEIKKRLITLGGDAALMSGSGSTVFGLYSDPKKRDQALDVVKREHPEWWVSAAEDLRGHSSP